MEHATLEIISGIGIVGIIGVIVFYLWLKKTITNDMIKPLIDPIEKEVNNLKEELIKRDNQLEKINETLEKNTITLQRIETIFDLLKDRIEIHVKDMK